MFSARSSALKPRVFVDAETNIVTIEAIHQHAALVERLFQRDRNRALAGTRQAGKPEGRSAVSQYLGPLGAIDLTPVPMHVGGFLFTHGGGPYQGGGILRGGRWALKGG